MNFDWNQKPFTGAMKYGRNYAPADFRPIRPELFVTLKLYVFLALGDLSLPFIFFKKKWKKNFFWIFLCNISTYVFRMASKFG